MTDDLAAYCRRGRDEAHERAQTVDNAHVAGRLEARAAAFEEVLETLQEREGAQ